MSFLSILAATRMGFSFIYQSFSLNIVHLKLFFVHYRVSSTLRALGNCLRLKLSIERPYPFLRARGCVPVSLGPVSSNAFGSFLSISTNEFIFTNQSPFEPIFVVEIAMVLYEF